MIWRRNANAAALICGFDVPTEVTRNNGASIPKGRMYVVSRRRRRHAFALHSLAHSLFLSNGAPLIIIIIIIIITHTQTFPVWTEETLQDLRQRKIKAEEIAVECMERLKEETRKMEETNNPLMKAMHFRNGK